MVRAERVDVFDLKPVGFDSFLISSNAGQHMTAVNSCPALNEITLTEMTVITQTFTKRQSQRNN